MSAVLFVCMGNICRSPMAEGVMAQRLRLAGLADAVSVDSAGTEAYHVGEPPDRRACATAAARGIDISLLRARQVRADDFSTFDLVLAMDGDNLDALRRRMPAAPRAHLARLLEYAPGGAELDVPDPYYGGPDGFERVLDLIESGIDGLLRQWRRGGPTEPLR